MAIWGDDKKTKEMTEAIVEGISETMAASITKTMQPLFTSLIGEIRGALSESKDQQAKASAEMADAMRGMKTVMDSVTSGIAAMQKFADGQQMLVERLAELQKQQTETQKSLTQECESAFNGVRDTQNKLSALYDSIGNGATALVAREEGVVKNQKKVIDTMTEDLLNLQGKWTDNFNKANVELTGRYEKMFSQMDSTITALKNYSNALSGATTSLNTAFDQFAAKMTTSLDSFRTGIDTTLTTLTTDVNKTMTEYNTGITSGFDGFTSKMQTSVSDTFAAIDQQLGAAVETLGKTTEEINEAALKIPKAMRGLNS